MKIENVSFGKMIIDGRAYDRDLIIFPDGRILSPWIRAQGHQLHETDLESLLLEPMQTLVVGTGINGRMRIGRALTEILKHREIRLESFKTAPAAEVFNTLGPSEAALGACFHLTC